MVGRSLATVGDDRVKHRVVNARTDSNSISPNKVRGNVANEDVVVDRIRQRVDDGARTVRSGCCVEVATAHTQRAATNRNHGDDLVVITKE